MNKKSREYKKIEDVQKAMAEINDAEGIFAFVEGDKRANVQELAEIRLTELAETAEPEAPETADHEVYVPLLDERRIPVIINNAGAPAENPEPEDKDSAGSDVADVAEPVEDSDISDKADKQEAPEVAKQGEVKKITKTNEEFKTAPIVHKSSVLTFRNGKPVTDYFDEKGNKVGSK